VSVPQDFYNCVCRAAGYGSSGTSQYYHPDTIGTYDKRYSCQHPGPPCIVSGYGCSRHPLPSDPEIFESCAAKAGLEGGNPLDNILTALRERADRTALTGNPVEMNADPAADPPPDCAKSRAEAGLEPLKQDFYGVPPDRKIWAISPDVQEKLDAALKIDPSNTAPLQQALGDALKKAIMANPQIAYELFKSADEVDLRFDMGPFEIGYTLNRDLEPHVSEIVYKESPGELPVLGEVDAEIALKFGLADPNAPDGDGLRITGGKIGFAIETSKGELKYGIDIDATKDSSDYYDGEWQKPSEYRLVAAVENFVSKLDFYGGGAANLFSVPLPGGFGVKVGPEFTWKLKERYSNWLFSDMHESLDNLLENQKEWEEQRHDYIAREAKRFGIDARCFTTGQTISLTHDAFERQKATDPTMAAPFQSITDRIAARRATPDAPKVAPPPIVPAAPPPPAPSEGIYQHQMLR
jgi:hypothetical protein